VANAEPRTTLPPVAIVSWDPLEIWTTRSVSATGSCTSNAPPFTNSALHVALERRRTLAPAAMLTEPKLCVGLPLVQSAVPVRRTGIPPPPFQAPCTDRLPPTVKLPPVCWVKLAGESTVRSLFTVNAIGSRRKSP
jgi:hypothetical protein